MIILNFTHPLTEKQQTTVATHIGEPVEQYLTLARRQALDQPLELQISALIDEIDLSAEDWQTRRIVVNPPAWAPAAVTLIAELHGRMGYFPEVIRVQQATGAGERYEVAEVIDLRAVRNAASHRRGDD